MIEGYVGNEIKRTNQNLLVTNIVIACIVLAIPVMFSRYLRECIGGPYPVTVESLAALQSAGDAPHRYVSISINQDLVDNMGYHILGGSDKKSDYYRFLHVAGGRYLTILEHTKKEDLPDVVQGSLTDLTSDVRDKVIPNMQGELEGTALPLMVDTGSYTTGMWAMIFICGPLLLLSVWNILKAVQRKGDQLKSPIAKGLAVVGPPEEMAVAVNAEVAEGGAKVGRVLTTQSWLVQPNTFNTILLYLGDIAWAYKSETKHKTNGVVTRVTFESVIYDVRGRKYAFPLTQDQVHTLLQELATRVPWAPIGYSAERQTAWTKDRKGVLDVLQERKRQVTAQQGGSGAA